MVRMEAVVLDDSGAAQFGHVLVDSSRLKGDGEIEFRLPGGFGAFHVSGENQAVVISVGGNDGVWMIELAGGEVRKFCKGSMVVIQDFGALAKGDHAGHRSRNSGSGELILTKVFLDSYLEVAHD